MTTIVMLKIISDLAFYYTFAGALAVALKTPGSVIMLALLIQSAAFTLSYVLREQRVLHYLILIPSAFCLFIPNAGIAGAAVMVPAVLYELWLAHKRLYEPEWAWQADIFSVFWKIFIVFIIAVTIFGGYDIMISFSIPCGLICLFSLVLQMRSLRHDKSVYCQKKYQLMNIALLAAVILIGGLLSSNVFLSACLTALKLLYKHVITPILTVVLYVILAFFKVAEWLFSFIHAREGAEEANLEVNLAAIEEMIGVEDPEISSGRLLERILIALGIILALVIIFFVFRYLARRDGIKDKKSSDIDYRSYASPKVKSTDTEVRGSNVSKVRTQYRKFLKLCAAIGYPPDKSDTSLDMNDRAGTNLGTAETEELRSIYINARYNDKAEKEDVTRARELYIKMKKNSD